MGPALSLRLPVQSPPVFRDLMTAQGRQNAAGVEPAATICDQLTGLAQSQCYAAYYNVNT
jgi:hypothetical protein